MTIFTGLQYDRSREWEKFTHFFIAYTRKQYTSQAKTNACIADSSSLHGNQQGRMHAHASHPETSIAVYQTVPCRLNHQCQRRKESHSTIFQQQTCVYWLAAIMHTVDHRTLKNLPTTSRLRSQRGLVYRYSITWLIR